MNGRLEKEIIAQAKMEKKLENLPNILSEYYIYLRAAKKTYTTIDVYMNYVIHFAKFICNNKISEDFYKAVDISDIERYLISLETRSVNGQLIRTGTDIQCGRWSGLNAFFDFLVKRGYLVKNPVVKTTRAKNNTEHQVVYLNKQEIKKIISVINKGDSGIMSSRDKTIVGLALSTGLRVSALSNINIEDIDFDNNVIHVIEKRNKIRDIAIGDHTKTLLEDWITIRNSTFKDIDTNALFISRNKNRICVGAINNMIKKYTKEAGITKNITPHKLRSSAATNMAANDISIQAIAKQLGHSSVNTTQRYVDVLNDEKEKCVKVLDNLF